MNPKVSVVMASYNCNQSYLKKSVESILNQTMGDFELIVIDDHTSSYTVKNVLSHVKDKRLRIYRNSVNLGLTTSLNVGIKVAKAEIIARMDADDISEKNRLQVQLGFLKKNIMYSFVGSDANIINDTGRVIRRKKRINSPEGVCFYSYINNPFMHSAVMFYRDCFYDVGGYNPYFKYSQDFDLWSRFLLKYKGTNIPKALIRWRESQQGISKTKCKEQTQFANTIVLNYFRNTLPELKDVPNSVLLAIRHNKFNKNTLALTDRVVRTMYEKFTCKYSRNWYESYLVKTKCFR